MSSPVYIGWCYQGYDNGDPASMQVYIGPSITEAQAAVIADQNVGWSEGKPAYDRKRGPGIFSTSDHRAIGEPPPDPDEIIHYPAVAPHLWWSSAGEVWRLQPPYYHRMTLNLFTTSIPEPAWRWSDWTPITKEDD